MMTLEQIRERNRKENAAARRLQAAGYRLEGWDPRPVPAVGVPASRLALAVLHPVRFCRLPEGSDSPLYRVVL